MGIAISAWFDSATESVIRQIWKGLHESDCSSTLHVGPYRPHVTFGVWQNLDGDLVIPIVRDICRTISPLPFSLPALGIFLNESPVVYLSVTASDRLLEMHTLITRGMMKIGEGPAKPYLPGRWNPHCTLVPDAASAKLGAIIESLVQLQLPILGTIDRIGVIDNPAEVELHEIPLSV